MANDIASLGIEVKTDSVKQAADDLDRLNQAGAETEQSASKAGAAWSNAAAQMSKAGTPAKQVSQSFGQGTQAVRDQQKELAALLGKIDPVVAALGRLDDMETELAKHKNLLGTEDFAVYSQKIQGMRDALGGADDQLARTGNSAKQTAAALRMLPAQFSDIAISLQAGQSPFQVLLQQGSQIKDSFGGIGPAFSAVGRYALSLVNPFTLAAAAVGTFGLAYKQGSDEQTEFYKSLVLTGNAAGTTTTQLAGMAKSVSGAVGTVGDAATVLTQLAGTGKIAASSFDTIAIAALKMQEATGKATSETVAEFAKLADDPVKASKALNDELNYLTTATYAQIQALQDSGDQLGAQALAEQTYADALSQHADAIQENLGYIESGWKAVKDAAKGAWDAFLDIGREQTLEDKLDSLAKRLRTMSSSGGLGGGLLSGFEAMQGDRSGIQSEITKALQEEQDKTEKAWREGLSAFNEKQGIDAVDALNTALSNSASNADKLKSRLAEIDKQIKTAAQNGVIYTEAQRQQLIAAAEEQYKDKTPKTHTPVAKAYQDDAATRMLQSLREQGAELQAQLGTQDKLTSAQKAQAQFQQLITDLKSKGQLTADQKSLLANQDAIKAQLAKNVAIDQEIQKRQQLAQIQSYQDALNSKLDTEKQGYQQQLEGIGQGSELRQRLREQLRIQQDYQRDLARLQSQYNRGQIPEDQYREETERLKASLDDRLNAWDDYYKQLQDKQKDWTNGAKDAFKDYVAAAKDTAKSYYDLFQNALQGTEDALTKFVMTGKLSFKDLANSIIEDLVRIQVRQSIAYAVGGASGTGGLIGLLSGIGSTQNASSAASSLGYSTSGYAGAYGFDGGGYTGDLPRMGGVDGKGGFMAILHPQETVIDHTKPSRTQGGNSTSNTFHINVSGGGSDRENKQAGATIGREINRVIQRSARYA